MEDVQRRVVDLERRVAALEKRRGARGPTAATPADLKSLEQLRRRRGPRYARGKLRGAVVYAGAVRLGDRESLWIKEHGVPEIADIDRRELARVFAALSHPTRLSLARGLLESPKTSQELQEVSGTASAGPLYHHLKEMVAAGVVYQSGRSRYEVAPERVVPLLTLLAVAGDLLPSAARGGGTSSSKHEEE